MRRSVSLMFIGLLTLSLLISGCSYVPTANASGMDFLQFLFSGNRSDGSGDNSNSSDPDELLTNEAFGESGPPAVILEYTDKKETFSMEVTSSTGTWYGEDGIAFIACGDHPLKWKDIVTVELSDEAEGINMSFQGAEPDFYTLYRWPERYRNYEDFTDYYGKGVDYINIWNGFIPFAYEEGGYIYEIVADWNDGSSMNYGFYIKPKDGK